MVQTERRVLVIEYVHSRINDTYDIVLPEFRHTFHELRPNWERGRLESCAELMQPGMTVFDLGAEHGDFTTLYKIWTGPTGDVIPVEPSDHYWPFVRDTFIANGFPPPSVCFHGFAGDEDIRFHRGLSRNAWPSASLGVGVPDGGFLHLAHETHKPRITIDTLAAYAEPDAIVMDIEGAELRACQGAIETLKSHRPIVWISMHPVPMWEWYNCTPEDVFKLFESVEYDVERLPDMGEIEDFYLMTPR